MKRIKCYNYAGDYVNSLVQWDRNQVVYVDDLENGAIPGVHYASTGYKDVSWEFTDVASLADDNRIKIKIPDIMMQYDGKLYLFLFYGENETIATTKYVVELTVKEKPKPDDWVWVDETWYKTMQQIQIDVSKVLSVTESKVNNPSEGKVGQILEIASVDMNGKPLTYIAVDKPRSITDDDIISPIATVTQTDTGATISIQDKNGTTTANIIHGRDGKDGENGQDGYTPVKGVDYFDGEKGDKGDKGDDGYTPQKGVDYFDGQDGKDGEKGADGTSVTVSNVSESIADGGSNVVTFSDGKTLTIKNGSKGKDGAKGEDGKDYILTDIDKKEIVQTIEDNVSVNIPTKTSQLENDSDYVTKDVTDNLSEQLANKEVSGTAQAKITEHNVSEDSHNDIRQILADHNERLNNAVVDSLQTSDIIDNLDTEASNRVLSANQGVVLKELIEALSEQLSGDLLKHTNTSGSHVTSGEKEIWNESANNMSCIIDQFNIVQGEKVTLIVGEDILVGQKITFRYKKSVGCSYSTYDADNFPLSIIDISSEPSSMIGEETLVITEEVSKVIFENAYFSLIKHGDEFALKSDLPSKTSQLENDSGFITEEDIPEVQMPDLSGYAKKEDIPTVPTKTSQLTNDSGFLTSVPSEYVTETELNAKKYLTSIPSEYMTETELNAKKYATQTDVNKFGGTIEVTSGNPTKENTVLTINPSADEINVYTSDEVDAIASRLEGQIADKVSQSQMETYINDTFLGGAW